MVVVIDYGVGNLRSVFNAFDLFGTDVKISSDAQEVLEAERVVLPGVGAFLCCVENLEKYQLKQAVLEILSEKKKPFLGICVGMQMLATVGYEDGQTDGLGLFEAEVKRFEINENLKVPHVGWNKIHLNFEHPVFKGVDDREMYFTHSYHMSLKAKKNEVAHADYGREFTCAVARDNIVACQFHPEKSGETGLRLIENFLDWNL